MQTEKTAKKDKKKAMWCLAGLINCTTFATQSGNNGTLFLNKIEGHGQIPEWPNGADCKSAVFRLRWFESIFAHKTNRV